MKHVTIFPLLCSMLLVANLSSGATLPQAQSESSPDIAQYPAPGGAKGVVDTYAGSDGKDLAYVSYTRPGARVALVYLHGIESHAGWFAIAADQLRERGYDVFCLDRRGSGLNRENRGFVSGHVDDYETLLADIRAFMVPLRDRYDEIFLVGLSWGGKLALSYGLTYPEHINGMILITPGLRAEVDVSLLSKLKIASLSPLHPTARVATPIQPEMFTTTPIYLQYIREDPLRLTSATVRFFWQSHRLDKYIDRNIKDNKISIQLFLAGQDTIIDNDGVLGLLTQSKGAPLDVIRYEDQTHSVQLDAAERLVNDMTEWLRR